MDNIKVNIHNYDEISHSLTVSFSKIIDGVNIETAPLCYDMINYADYNTDEMIEKISENAPNLIEQQIKKNNLDLSLEKQAEFKNMIGREIVVDVQPPVDIDQQTGEDLEVVV